ncbi:putative phosphotransferase Gmet_3384 [Candidatus Methylomirabilis oxygeniifera]|uniref:Putative pyruvate, phosphate dikinase regulatory protein n=1 Tax=Methylomirabilis oxygeniifera TaxID=671143 RepID=D5MFP3_METO1|nr:putative phosphotransferase Gmet_3384 [Candidatus Methylomirabilis oxyfera]
MMNLSTAGGRHQILAISDATGATAELVVQAALAQFQAAEVEIRRLPNIRTVDEVRRVIEAAHVSKAIIVHTLVSEELRQTVLREGRERGVETIDLIGPLLLRLSDQLRVAPLMQPGLFRQLGQEYLHRIEAIEYTVKHDDGQHPLGLDRADIVLVGISRTSKTPLSIYLAGKGWRVANVPIILNLPLPGRLMTIDQDRIVGLVVAVDRLVELRRARIERKHAPVAEAYAELEKVRAELSYSRSLFRKAGWPVIDMTCKSIEEAASELLTIIAPPDTPPATESKGTGARRKSRGKTQPGVQGQSKS